jgi:hypothetical protein
MARLYIFRPDISVRSKEDEPTLIIDNLHEMKLSRWSYANFVLPLGKHRFKLISGKSDSDIWNMEGEFDAKAAGRYYLAIWNSLSAEGGEEFFDLSQTLLFFQRPVMPNADDVYEYARYELVDEQQALETMRGCRLSTTVRSPAARP